MSRVGVNCDPCGTFEIPASALQLVLFPTHPRLNRYVFRCPNCSSIVAKDATQFTVVLLQSAGVTATTVTPPAELTETHFGPPICSDDLIDFGLGLRMPHFADLASA